MFKIIATAKPATNHLFPTIYYCMVMHKKLMYFGEFPVPRGKYLNSIAPKAYGHIKPEEHLALKKVGSKAELTLLSRDGVAIGKAFLQLLEQGETLSDVNEIVINASSTADLQFITNYLVCPPGKEFAQRFQGNKITVRLHNFKAALQLPALITTAGMGKDADEVCSILPELFRKDVQYEIVETTKMNRANLLKQLKRTDKELDKRADLSPELKTNIRKTLQQIKEYITSDKLVFINKNQTFEQRTLQGHRAYANQSYVKELLAGKTLYVESDEITHLKLLDKTLYVIDTGNPSTVAYVKALLKQDPECIKEVVIMQTHFHNDHCARLPELLSFIRKNRLPTKLVFNKDLHHQFAGFLMTNLRVFRNNPQLKILPIAEGTTKEASFSLFNDSPDLIRHYIQSSGYFLQNGDNAMFFTGDINPPVGNNSSEKIVVAVYDYFLNILQKTLDKKISRLDIFADAGHFSAISELANGFGVILEQVERDLKAKYKLRENLRVRLLNEHKKSPRNYVTAILPD